MSRLHGSSDCCLLTKKHSQDSQALNEKHSAKPPESDSCFIVLAATFPNRVISLDFMFFFETVSAWNKIYRPWRASPCLPQLSGPSWHGFTPRLQRLLIDRIHHDSTIYAYPPPFRTTHEKGSHSSHHVSPNVSHQKCFRTGFTQLLKTSKTSSSKTQRFGFFSVQRSRGGWCVCVVAVPWKLPCNRLRWSPGNGMRFAKLQTDFLRNLTHV